MPITSEVATLANGLRVVATPLASAQSVSVNVFVGAGSRCEDRRVNGLAHFLEHMLFKGTGRRPSPLAIAEAIEGAGGTLNAYTSKEITCYWNLVPDDRLALAMDVLADMIAAPLLPSDEIERERSVVHQEIRRGHDQPGQWVVDLLMEAWYGEHPLGWNTAGSEETVSAARRDDFAGYMQRWYGPQNLVLSVAGNTSLDKVVPLAEGFLSKHLGDAVQPFPGADIERPHRRVVAESRPIAQCNMALALPGMARQDPDRYILIVLNNILGRGMSSRLFKEVREKRGLAYSVSSSPVRHSDSGMLMISAGVSREKMVETVKVCLGEVARLSEEKVNEEELTRARDYSIGNFRLSLETSMALGQRAGELLLTTGEIEPIEATVEGLKAVGAEDIRRVAGRIWQPQRTALAMVGPDLDEGELAEAMAA